MKASALRSAIAWAIGGSFVAGFVLLVFGPAWTPLNSDFSRTQDIDRARVRLLVRPDTSLEVREAFTVRQSSRRDSLDVHEDIVAPPGVTFDDVAAVDRTGRSPGDDRARR